MIWVCKLVLIRVLGRNLQGGQLVVEALRRIVLVEFMKGVLRVFVLEVKHVINHITVCLLLFFKLRLTGLVGLLQLINLLLLKMLHVESFLRILVHHV